MPENDLGKKITTIRSEAGKVQGEINDVTGEMNRLGLYIRGSWPAEEGAQLKAAMTNLNELDRDNRFPDFEKLAREQVRVSELGSFAKKTEQTGQEEKPVISSKSEPPKPS